MNSDPLEQTPSKRQIAAPAKILIVDDQIDNLRLLSQILVEQGYEIRKAINGTTALMGVKSFSPDLILLDINMPGLSGYEVCQQLKSDRSTRQIPIIFLSASDQVMNKVRAFEVGGVDYVTKPFQVPEILARVKTHIKLKRFSQMRENLSKAIVHDLKNPLSVITFTSSSLIRRERNRQQSLESLQTINTTAQRLDSMLNDLLMVAKMDAEKLILHSTAVNLNQLIANTVKGFTAAAQEKQIDLICQIPEAAQAKQLFSLDINLFQRAIENLLSNALKFSPTSSKITVQLSYQVSVANSDRSYATIKVIDQGKGIKPELHQQIFETYNTGEYIDGVSQIGLGLSFCKMVVEAHKGNITLENNKPKGAVFVVKIPNLN